MQGPTAAPRCCQHCLNDLPVALTYELCDQTRRNQVQEPYQPWWPAHIDSPTLYYRLKRRSMDHQCREQARLGPYSDPAVWRAPHTSAAGGAPNLLLARRGQCQLSLRLPAGRTNLTAADELQFVGVQLSLHPHLQEQQQQHAAAAAAEAVLQQLEQQYAAAAAAQQRQQAVAAAAQAQAQAHTVLRPRSRRAAPPPPSSTAPAAHPACLPQAPAPHASLLASLLHREQQHRQQLAAACHPQQLAAEPRPAAYGRPASWQCGWQGMQPAQPQQQQVEAPHWPYTVPQQQQGGWAYASSLPPLPCQRQLAPAAAMAAMAACC